MRLLITGGAGFLGAALAKRARALHDVVTLDRSAADILCDIGDADAVRRAIDHCRPDVVVHLAALLTPDSAADPVAATRINALGTAAVFAAAAAARAARVVFASSGAAVGPGRASGDTVALQPATVYGATKAFGEHLARVSSGAPRQPSYVVLRFGWVYGPGRERGWRAVQEVIEQFAHGASLVRYPDYAEAMDFTYVNDAAEVLLRACDRPLPAYSEFNVLGERRTMRDLVAHLQGRFPGVKAEAVPDHTPATAWHLRNDGLQRAIGYVPATTLEEGVDALIEALGR